MKLDTLAKQALLFVAFPLMEVSLNGKATVSTSFVFNAGISLDSDETVALLVSNKHILEGAAEIEFDFWRGTSITPGLIWINRRGSTTSLVRRFRG